MPLDTKFRRSADRCGLHMSGCPLHKRWFHDMMRANNKECAPVVRPTRTLHGAAQQRARQI
jgi:hypothetical protein